MSKQKTLLGYLCPLLEKVGLYIKNIFIFCSAVEALKALHCALVKSVTENSIWFSKSTFHLNVKRYKVCCIERTFLRFLLKHKVKNSCTDNLEHYTQQALDKKKIIFFSFTPHFWSEVGTWFDNQKMESFLTLVSMTYFSKLVWMEVRYSKWFEEMIRLLLWWRVQ